MTSEKRRKQLAREKYERQQARRAVESDRRKSRQRIIAIVVVAALVIASGAWVVISRMTSSGDTTASATSAPSIAPQPSTASSGSAGSTAPVALDCTAPGTPRADDKTYGEAPKASALSGKAAVITLTTNCGPIAITTIPDKAPLTVASEVFLAQDGFYDNTKCHRVTTSGIFVLQCGDPKGDGTGGPGYSVPDENLPTDQGVNYPAGTVAMANAGPGTAGSQFFIVYGDTTLPAGYTVWGTVTEGLDLVKAIAAVGAEGGSGDGAPVQPVFIQSASVAAA